MSVLTNEDWMFVLQEAFKSPSQDGLLSKRELMQQTGLGNDALTRRINLGMDIGLIIPETAPRLGRCLQVKPTQCYRLDKEMLEKLKNERR